MATKRRKKSTARSKRKLPPRKKNGQFRKRR